MRKSIGFALALSLPGCGLIEPDPETWGMPEDQKGRAENARFASLVDAYLAWNYAAHPTWATGDGIHDYDDRLPDVSAAGIAAEAASQERWLERVRALDRNLLSEEAAVDHEILDFAIQSALVDIGDVRTW